MGERGLASCPWPDRDLAKTVHGKENRCREVEAIAGAPSVSGGEDGRLRILEAAHLPGLPRAGRCFLGN